MVLPAFVRNCGLRLHAQAGARHDAWIGAELRRLAPESLLDVGCGDGGLVSASMPHLPRELHGVEGAPTRRDIAAQRGFMTYDFDLNRRWPLPDSHYDVVLSSQVIEHLHNTLLFVTEMHRVLKPGGTAIVTSENLASLLNWIALSLGYAPFSLMQVCGTYLGNPLGLHYGEKLDEPLPVDHPAYSGVSGHVRVLTVRQAREVFAMAGFRTEVNSIGLMPLPGGVGRVLEYVFADRGHFMLIRAVKCERD